MTRNTNNRVMFVTFSPRRLSALCAATAGTDHVAVMAFGATAGLRVDAVVFVDGPDAHSYRSAVLREQFFDWLECAVKTRLRPGCENSLFNVPDMT